MATTSLHKRSLSAPDVQALAIAGETPIHTSYSGSNLEELARQRRGDREEAEMLQVCLALSRAALSRSARSARGPRPLIQSSSPPSHPRYAPRLCPQAVLLTSALEVSESPSKQQRTDISEKIEAAAPPCDPLMVGETPSFNELFG